MDDDTNSYQNEVTIDEDMIWGCRVSEEDIRIYLNEGETITLTNNAAMALLRALIQALEHRQES